MRLLVAKAPPPAPFPFPPFSLPLSLFSISLSPPLSLLPPPRPLPPPLFSFLSALLLSPLLLFLLPPPTHYILSPPQLLPLHFRPRHRNGVFRCAPVTRHGRRCTSPLVKEGRGEAIDARLQGQTTAPRVRVGRRSGASSSAAFVSCAMGMVRMCSRALPDASHSARVASVRRRRRHGPLLLLLFWWCLR